MSLHVPQLHDSRDNGQRFRDEERSRADDENMSAHWERIAEINAFGPFSRVQCPESYPPFFGTKHPELAPERVEDEDKSPACIECGDRPIYRSNICINCWRAAHD
jgi:hypothetical protein